jgi:aerobic C4-dicarboxylate transport protein
LALILRLSSLGLLVGIDHFMSVGRAVTNFIGNALATVAISRWEGQLSAEELRGRRAGLDG